MGVLLSKKRAPVSPAASPGPRTTAHPSVTSTPEPHSRRLPFTSTPTAADTPTSGVSTASPLSPSHLDVQQAMADSPPSKVRATATEAGPVRTAAVPSVESTESIRSSCITPGNIRDHFSFGKVLGRGAFSNVREGVHRVTGQRVAIKIIHSKQFADPRQQAIVFNEIAVMKRVSEEKHPNIIQFIGAYEDSHHLYIVLNVCQGGELFDRIIERGHYSEADASEVIRKLLDALRHLHSRRILHRDMKPENCLLETKAQDAEVVITDFGLAQDMDREDVHKSLVGTPGYVAPEVLSLRQYGESCDVWALGVMLYILLVGYPPFYADTNAEMFEQIKAGLYAFHEDAWGEISEAAKDLVSKMLTVSTADRITVTGALEHPFIVNHQSETPLKNTVALIKKFNAKRKFRAAAMACVWGARMQRSSDLEKLTGSLHFSPKEIMSLQTAFKAAAGESGIVDLPQFQEIMTSLGFNTLPLPRVFELFDMDGNGEIDYREFLCGLIVLKRNGEEALEFCFKLYDADESGFISREELSQVLGVIATTDEKHEMEKVDKLTKMFETMDIDRDGRISFDEFKAGIEKEPMLTAAFLKPIAVPPTIAEVPEDSEGAGASAGAGSGAGASVGAGAGAGAGADASLREKRPRPEDTV